MSEKIKESVREVANLVIDAMDDKKIYSEEDFYKILALVLKSCCVHNKVEAKFSLLEKLVENTEPLFMPVK